MTTPAEVPSTKNCTFCKLAPERRRFRTDRYADTRRIPPSHQADAAYGQRVLAAGVSHSDGTGRIYVLDQTSGAAVFTLATDGKIFAEPTWANGVLYVVDLAGSLYALSP